MPIYEYHCENCNLTFEELRPVDGRNSVTCKECGTTSSRVFSTFHFKDYNKFTKDGPGFQSIDMTPDEFNHRVKERSLEEALRRNGRVPIYYNSGTNSYAFKAR